MTGVPIPSKKTCLLCKYCFDSVRNGYVCLMESELLVVYGIEVNEPCPRRFPKPKVEET